VGKIVFWRTLLFGPMLAGVIYNISLILISLFSEQQTRLFIDEVITSFIAAAFLPYIFVFIPLGLPPIIPLFCFAHVTSNSIEPLINALSGYKPYIKVMAIILLNIIVGVFIYGLFFLLTPWHAKEVVRLLVQIVIPTSIIFGVYFGVYYLRKHS